MEVLSFYFLIYFEQNIKNLLLNVFWNCIKTLILLLNNTERLKYNEKSCLNSITKIHIILLIAGH